MLWSLRKLMDDLARENLCNQQASDIKIALSKNTDSLCNYFFSLSSTKSFPKLQSKMVRISHDWLCMMIEWCWIILCSAGVVFFLNFFIKQSGKFLFIFCVLFVFLHDHARLSVSEFHAEMGKKIHHVMYIYPKFLYMYTYLLFWSCFFFRRKNNWHCIKIMFHNCVVKVKLFT